MLTMPCPVDLRNLQVTPTIQRLRGMALLGHNERGD
jgi:hypothetical protein